MMVPVVILLCAWLPLHGGRRSCMSLRVDILLPSDLRECSGSAVHSMTTRIIVAVSLRCAFRARAPIFPRITFLLACTCSSSACLCSLRPRLRLLRILRIIPIHFNS